MWMLRRTGQASIPQILQFLYGGVSDDEYLELPVGWVVHLLFIEQQYTLAADHLSFSYPHNHPQL